MLTQYRDVLDHLVVELLEKETLNEAELADIFAPVQKRPERPVWHSSPDRPLHDAPGPVDTPAQASAQPDVSGEGIVVGPHTDDEPPTDPQPGDTSNPRDTP